MKNAAEITRLHGLGMDTKAIAQYLNLDKTMVEWALRQKEPGMDEKVVYILRLSDEPACLHAADLIEFLRAENEKLRKQNKECKAAHKEMFKMLCEQKKNGG